MNDNEILIKEESDESIQTWANRSYISSELREQLLKADAVLVPSESYGKFTDSPHFPEATEEFFQFLRTASDGKISFDICIEEREYKELALHHDVLIIAGIVTTVFVAPLIVNLTAEYIKRRIWKRNPEAKVQSTLTIQDKQTGRSISYRYEGDASTYENVMVNALKGIVESSTLIAQDSKEVKLIAEKKDSENNHESRRDSKIS
jgi:hypothetical protein